LLYQDKSVQKQYDLLVPEKSKYVRLDLDFMGAEAIPLGKDKIKFKCVLKTDPKLKFIPLNFLNWLTRKVDII
jgi:hypothetical protein